jgi:hypothetical protein
MASFSACQRAVTRVLRSLTLASSSLQFAQSLLAGLVLLFLQRLALDLQLHDLAVDLIQFGRLAVDLHPQAAGGLVDQVDGLVGQEAVTDVAVAERGRGNDGASVMRTPWWTS